MKRKNYRKNEMQLNSRGDKADKRHISEIKRRTPTEVMSAHVCVMETLSGDSFWGPAGATNRSEQRLMGEGEGWGDRGDGKTEEAGEGGSGGVCSALCNIVL